MKTIDGIMLKQMIISGANYLFNCYPEVDALNVFPVPDGDTGTNMNLTMQSGAKEIQNRNDSNAYNIAKAFSKGTLLGARGNSGVILSQIFRGFAMALEGKEYIDAITLAKAFANGRDIAYKGVLRPVEGTILTVIREASDFLEKKVTQKMDVDVAFDLFLKEANKSLERTPNLLPILKEVGVVDSGGAGLCKILHGFKKALEGKMVEKSVATAVTANQPISTETVIKDEDGGYVLEFVLELPKEPTDCNKKIFVEKRFANVLVSHGSDVNVLVKDKYVKASLKTLAPGSILTYAQQFGEFVNVSINNVTKDDANKEINFDEEPLQEYAIIAVAAGDGIENKFLEYGATKIVSGGQTMNPSTEDFVHAIKECHAKKVFILPNNSNIIMAATQACEVNEEGIEARVIPTKTIPQGLVACMMFNPEGSFDDNEAEMNEAITNVKTGQVTFAIKDSLIDGVEVVKDHFIGISEKQIICCHSNKIKTTYEMVTKMVDEMTSIITLIYGEDTSLSEVNSLIDLLSNKCKDVEIETIKGNQPVYSFIVGIE